ncbi:hypothetical protein TL16_g05082 [Triparma laevis f. inornata]|uniref:Uncharacterized protein n=1 Tax=Triparma laevis f. inornata TaxID=1714386 RepID=A0A9W7E8N9_9STRA|nr:hypothetical protein TL16_g05082 [Triparma laevis f. inornata]
MRDTHSYNVDASIPEFVDSPKCFKNMLFFTWFEFIGMNHYDGRRLWMDSDLEERLCEGKIYDGKVKIERRVKPESRYVDVE